jgi:glycosyltransferase involved in cell wall biosynthesis
MKVWLELGPTLDTADWQARHARGEVPDAWPYGLDRLRRSGMEVAAGAPPRGADALAARVLRRAGGQFQWWEAARRRVPPGTDVVACWAERAGVPVALRERSVPVATGVIWLTEPGAIGRAGARAARAGLRRAAAVWTLSSAQLPVLAREWGVERARLHHLPFGVDADFFSPGGEPQPGVVLSVGNDRHRDHETVLKAVAQVRGAHPRSRLSLVTRAPVDVPPELGTRTVALPHDRLAEEYRRSAVVAVALQPNLHVSGITVVLEAMACGRPVVVTGTPGMTDYVTHGENGLLVPPGDPAAMAAAVGALLADPERAAAVGAAGRRAVVDHFSTARQAETLAAILRTARA